MSLEETVRELAPRLLRYCSGRLGDVGLAEEVAQETLAVLVARWRRLGPPDSPAAFVFKVAQRRCARRWARSRLASPLEYLVGQHDPAPGPAERTLFRLELAATREALDQLGRRDREALLLVAAGELPVRDAAQLLGISESAFKMRVHRARQRLAALMESNDDAQERIAARAQS